MTNHLKTKLHEAITNKFLKSQAVKIQTKTDWRTIHEAHVHGYLDIKSVGIEPFMLIQLSYEGQCRWQGFYVSTTKIWFFKICAVEALPLHVYDITFNPDETSPSLYVTYTNTFDLIHSVISKTPIDKSCLIPIPLDCHDCKCLNDKITTGYCPQYSGLEIYMEEEF